MTRNRTRAAVFAILSGASLLAFGSTAQAQGPEIPGICLTDERASTEICACFDESGVFQPNQTLANGRFCRDNEEGLDLLITGAIPEPMCEGPDCEPCTGPNCGGNLDEPQNNGIGNGVQTAPGNSGETFGDDADNSNTAGTTPTQGTGPSENGPGESAEHANQNSAVQQTN